MFLLDTDIATLVFHNHERVLERMAKVSSDQIALALVTRLEMLLGRIQAVMKAATAEELLRAVDGLAMSETFLGQFPITTIDKNAAERFEQLRAIKKLNKMDRGDLLQAAIALANDATLVRRNTKDYANVPNLKLDNWAA
jgi:tRNA(fMet)-specific endonuclease VapC